MTDVQRAGPRGASPLVGRKAELDALAESLLDARAGGSVAVAVVGEPGIGKTRLLDVLCERAARAGFAVLAGAGSEFEQEVPFGLVVDALDAPVGALEPAALRRLGDERLAELATVLPSLASVGGGLTTTLEVERYRCHHAMRAVLEQMARDRPVLLALDDVHWADPASIELLSHLLRRGLPHALLALAYRPFQSPRQLVRGIEGVRGEALRWLELAPLSLQETVELLGDELDAPGLESVYRESGGIPLYLEQLARALTRGAALPQLTDPESVEAAAVPAGVRATIAGELERLSRDARRLAQAAAVIGEPFDLDLAAEITSLDAASTYAALDELTAADLLRATAVPRHLRFRHPIVRRAVYDHLGSGSRLVAHERAAGALTRRGASLAVQAHHVERSAAPGDEQAVALLTAAGHSAGPRAPAAAARWFQAAARLLSETAPAAQRLSLLTGLASALGALGRLDDTRSALQQALELLPSDDAEARMRIVAMIARAEQGLGRGDIARGLLDQALAHTLPGSPEVVALEIELAKNHAMLHEWDEAVGSAREAATLARTLGDRPLLLAATACSAFVQQFHGSLVRDAQASADAAAAEIDGFSDESASLALEALSNLVYAELSLGRWERSEAHAERGLALCRSTGQGHVFIDFTLALAVARQLRGNLSEARRAAEMAVEASLLLHNDQSLALTEGTRAWIAALQGELRTALAAGQNAVRAAARAPHSLFAWHAHICYGAALIEAGQIQRGRDEILAAGGPELAEVPPTSRPHWHKILAEAELAEGRIDAGETMTRRAESAAVSLGLPMRTADAGYARACMLLARGEPERAAIVARGSAEGYARAETHVEAGRAHLLAGRAEALAGDSPAAAREFQQAYATWEACGAARLADRAAKELRSLGKRTARRGRTQAGPGALTNREREVAELVCRGLTNREIAAELFLSHRTVENHLSSVFAKLGCSSRAAVAAEIAHRHAIHR